MCCSTMRRVPQFDEFAKVNFQNGVSSLFSIDEVRPVFHLQNVKGQGPITVQPA